MRARDIKPGLYKNEYLAECSFQARYLFPGLWMLADREGRLEDRPKKIKAELFPYDDVDINALLGELVKYGFIARYEIDGACYIEVLNFTKHQRPHSNETPSSIPPMPEGLSTKVTSASNLGGKDLQPRNEGLSTKEESASSLFSSSLYTSSLDTSSLDGEITPPSEAPPAEDKPENVEIPQKPPDCPQKEIVTLYHEILPELPVVRDWTPQRQEFLRARWKSNSEYQSLDFWRQYFLSIRNMDWLMGRKEGRDGRPFFATLEWLVRPSNFTNVIEGKYMNRKGPQSPGAPPQAQQRKPLTYEEAKAMENGDFIDAEFRRIGGG